MLHTRNNTDGNKLMIFSRIVLYYGDTYIVLNMASLPSNCLNWNLNHASHLTTNIGTCKYSLMWFAVLLLALTLHYKANNCAHKYNYVVRLPIHAVQEVCHIIVFMYTAFGSHFSRSTQTAVYDAFNPPTQCSTNIHT